MRLHVTSLLVLGCLASCRAPALEQAPQPPESYLQISGDRSFVEIPGSAASVSAQGLTVAAWVRPDVLTFKNIEGRDPQERYVHWLGKGERAKEEWTFRMYSRLPPDTPGPRANRISFYLFNPEGLRGCGSYFQDPIVAGEWMHVVGVADASASTTAIYKNGELRHSDSYRDTIAPAAGSAPLRFGTRDLASFFQGGIGPVLVWDRPLTASEVHDLYAAGVVPQDHLVARYALTEGSGSVVHDSAGGPDGVLTAVTWGTAKAPIQHSTGTSGGGC
jgi:concanavalin A-like lectin/glucanase superfamily protein